MKTSVFLSAKPMNAPWVQIKRKKAKQAEANTDGQTSELFGTAPEHPVEALEMGGVDLNAAPTAQGVATATEAANASYTWAYLLGGAVLAGGVAAASGDSGSSSGTGNSGSSANTGGTVTPASSKGYLVDSPIAGVDYYINGVKKGTTDKDGLFVYSEGDEVVFKVGKVVVGSITQVHEDDTVYLGDLAGVGHLNFTDPKVIALAQFFQTLDEDKDANNGISLTEKSLEALLDNLSEDADFDDYFEDITELFDAEHRDEVVGAEEAGAHAVKTLFNDFVVGHTWYASEHKTIEYSLSDIVVVDYVTEVHIYADGEFSKTEVNEDQQLDIWNGSYEINEQNQFVGTVLGNTVTLSISDIGATSVTFGGHTFYALKDDAVDALKAEESGLNHNAKADTLETENTIKQWLLNETYYVPVWESYQVSNGVTEEVIMINNNHVETLIFEQDNIQVSWQEDGQEQTRSIAYEIHGNTLYFTNLVDSSGIKLPDEYQVLLENATISHMTWYGLTDTGEGNVTTLYDTYQAALATFTAV